MKNEAQAHADDILARVAKAEARKIWNACHTLERIGVNCAKAAEVASVLEHYGKATDGQ